MEQRVVFSTACAAMAGVASASVVPLLQAIAAQGKSFYFTLP